MMESNEIKTTEITGNKAASDEVKEKKVKFPVYLPPDAMELMNMLYQRDNCRSKTEFMEKALRFYCGYLLTKESAATDFLAPQIAEMTDGIVSGSEQKLSRAMFKIAVELGAVTHMLAAMNHIDEQTLHSLRAMCTDEVRKINGIINFEKAVRFQHSE